MALINATGSEEYVEFTSSSGVIILDVTRKSYTFNATLTSAGHSYKNVSITKDYSTVDYTVHTDSVTIYFSRLVRLRIQAFTNTSPPQIIQDGYVKLTNNTGYKVDGYASNHVGKKLSHTLYLLHMI